MSQHNSECRVQISHMGISPVRMLTSLLVMLITCLRVISGEEEAMLSAVTINTKYLTVQDNDLPHLVLFFTPWSKYSQRVSSEWEALAEKYNNMEKQQVSGEI